MANYKDSEDISIKELFHTISDYWRFLWSRKGIIISAGVIVALVFMVFALTQKPKYEASLTFMLNEDTSGPWGNFSNLMGQFGIGPGITESNLDKIIELSRSRTIAENMFFDSVVLDNKNDFLANHLISYFEKNKKWDKKAFFSMSKKDIPLDSFRFVHSKTDSFTIRENKALKHLHILLTGDERHEAQFRGRYNELTGIMELSMLSSDQELAIQVVNNIFEKLSQFYIKNATEKQDYEYHIIKAKYDSINDRLSSIQYQLAEFQDKYQNLFRRKDALQEKRLRAEEQKLMIMTGEAEKQLQIASLAVDNKTPYVQVIDRPIAPLEPENKSVLYWIIIGLFVGMLVTAAYLAGRKAVGDILNS